MSLVQNPSLLCIQVDLGFNPPPNGAGGWYKDATASYNTFCPPVSINNLENKKLENIQIYPNPTVKDLTINLNKNYNEIAILVSNTIGQTVLSKQYTAKQFINLNLEGNSGVYFVTIFTEEGISTTKIVKE